MRRGPPPKERAATALRRTLRTSALPFRYWACFRPWRGPCGDGAAPIGVHSCQEGKGYTSGGFAWCRGLGLAVLERWHHGEWDACGDGGAWRTRMHPRVSRYHQLARLRDFGEPNGPTETDTGRRRATYGDECLASWLFGRRWATSGDDSVASYKRGVTGSNPVAPTRSEGLGFPVSLGAKRREKGQAGSPVADASVRRRGHGGDAICFAADKNRTSARSRWVSDCA